MAFVSGASWPLLIVSIVAGTSLTLLLSHSLVLEARIAGALWLLLFLTLTMLFEFPGGAHVMLWPLLVILLMQAWRWRYADGKHAAPQLLLLVGMPAAVSLGATALTFDRIIGHALPTVSVVPILLLLAFFLPLLDNRSSPATGFGIVLIGIAGLGRLLVTPAWTAEKPRPVSLFVLHDADQLRTFWASHDDELTDWHHSALGGKPTLADSSSYQPDAPIQTWLSPIDGIIVAAPQIELIAADHAQQRLTLRVRPGRAGDTLTIWLKPDTNLRGWQVEGESCPLNRTTRTAGAR